MTQSICKVTQVRFSGAPKCAAEPSLAACCAMLTAHGQSTRGKFLSPDAIAQFRTHLVCVDAACEDLSVPCASPEDGAPEDVEFFPAALIVFSFLAAASVFEYCVRRSRDALALLGLSRTVGL